MGEASKPGPPKYRRRRVVDSDDDVLASLEHELTCIDPGSLHRQSDVLDALEQDLMSHRNARRRPKPELDGRRGQSRCHAHPVNLRKG